MAMSPIPDRRERLFYLAGLLEPELRAIEGFLGLFSEIGVVCDREHLCHSGFDLLGLVIHDIAANADSGVGLLVLSIAVWTQLLPLATYNP